MTAQPSAALGTFDLTITGVGGGIAHVVNGHATLDFGLVPECSGRVHGRVTDKVTGLAVLNAEVTLDDEHVAATTDASGAYTIENVLLGVNNSPVNVGVHMTNDPPQPNHVGEYWPNETSGLVICDDPRTAIHETTELDVVMTKVIPASLTGRVVEGLPDPSDYGHVISTNTGIGNVTQTLSLCDTCSPFDSEQVATTVTAADGRYAFDKFQVGPENAPYNGYLNVETTLPARHGYWSDFGVPRRRFIGKPDTDRTPPGRYRPGHRIRQAVHGRHLRTRDLPRQDACPEFPCVRLLGSRDVWRWGRHRVRADELARGVLRA